MKTALPALALSACLAVAPARAQTIYGGLDYLLWSLKAAPLSAPLISSGPAADNEGVLVSPATQILYGAPFAPASGGKDHQAFSLFSGGRLTLGATLDRAGGLGLEASGFGLQSRSAGYQSGGSGGSLGGYGIRVPLYNAVPYFIGVPTDAVAAENGLPVFIPAILGGQVTVSNRLSLWGAEAFATMELYRAGPFGVTGLAGLRTLDLAEDLDLVDTFFGQPDSYFQGQSGTVRDHFGTRNRFIGPALGLRAAASWGPVSLSATGRVALGDMHQQVNVAGGFQAVNYAPTSGPEGIFAQPANAGRRSADSVGVVPDLQVKLGYDVTPSLRLTVGYDFLYMNSVVRPGDQIDRNIPKGQVFQQGGSAISTSSPGRLFRTSDFYAHGLSAGVSFRF